MGRVPEATLKEMGPGKGDNLVLSVITRFMNVCLAFLS